MKQNGHRKPAHNGNASFLRQTWILRKYKVATADFIFIPFFNINDATFENKILHLIELLNSAKFTGIGGICVT